MGAVLHGRRRRLPPSPDRGRAHPAPGGGHHDPGAVGTGQVGHPAGGLAGGGSDDGPGTGRDARPHGADAAGARGPGRTGSRMRDGGVAWTIEGGMAVQAIDERVPGDVSAAAFWLVAGAIHPDAELTLRDVGVNPTRRAVIDLLRRDGRRHRGAARRRRPRRPRPDGRRCRRAAGRPDVRSSDLRAIDLGPADVAAAIDEIPVLCLAAARARGTTTIRGAGELRHKESDRIAGIAAGLAAHGRTRRGRRRRPAHPRRNGRCAARRPTASTTTGWR